ncbi:Cysteine-rich domain-containing protein [Desulfonatronum thiosulfatophilum]|uniref:Cysteine-rich domain-containing protein n=3 Tax=Desulfonatronum thiosulfatophilum TaxID=617002 RepID=A0A1G6CXZ3_9BACT|nr:(Fe-S)-binding protein [Desulfonatronum thiosulfatophilum]SDB37762.1 Cysteine-rich domain-containing protein [Desulfonatronum thiosulfatophilum]
MKALGFEAPLWLGKQFSFEATPPIKVWADCLRSGALKLIPGFHQEPATFQDSCNFIRNAGMYKQSRELMSRVAADFREMHPHGNATYCCGNGGGQGLMPEYKQAKIAALKAKAESIRATGAKMIVVACHNCEDGIQETCKAYELDAKVELFSAYLAEAVDLGAV